MTAASSVVDTTETEASPLAEERTVVTQQGVIDVIVKETGCTPADAEQCITWTKNIVDRARRSSGYLVHPQTRDMATGTGYSVFDKVMPHDAVPVPGSAGAALTDHVLDRARDEFALEHHQVRSDRTYCAVLVRVHGVS